MEIMGFTLNNAMFALKSYMNSIGNCFDAQSMRIFKSEQLNLRKQNIDFESNEKRVLPYKYF